MLFNSIEYLVFLPVVLLLYWMSSHSVQNKLLLVASYFFYGLWDIRFLFLIVLSTCIDYLIGILLDKNRLTTGQYWKSSGWLFFSAIIYLLIPWSSQSSILNNNTSYISNLSFTDFGMDVIIYISIVWAGVALLARQFIPKLSISITKKIYLAISVFANLLILGFFKYFNFFIDSAETIITTLGGDVDMFHLNVILPVGISFYTFQTMSYSLDIYRGKIKSTEHFFDFALFVAYFPQLVAGPIERASNLLPRIINKRVISYEQFIRGVELIGWGLFKKIAIADGLAVSVNSVYTTSGIVSFLDIIFATVLFAIQIYCDFSAYSDIARGSSKLMGIELMRNFNLPYFSRNPSEFWRRWHISLSSWLRDYLYIPLGGNRGGALKTYRNLSITMLLGGLWHGAAWNYVLWGAYQGAILSIHRYFFTEKESPIGTGFRAGLKIILFFGVTCYGWMLFRATSLEQIIEFTSILLFDWTDLSVNMKKPTLGAILALPILLLYEFTEYKTGDIKFYRVISKPIAGFAIAIMTLFLAMGLSNETSQFIYFQF